MLTHGGLYYPYIHFRDESWLKVAALYWPSMARIVPRDYATMDSRTVRALNDADFVIDIALTDSDTGRSGSVFLDLVRQHGASLRRSLASSPSDSRWDDIPDLGFIHASKVSEQLRRALVEQGLATLTGDPRSRERRHSLTAPGHTWLGMDPRLSAVYMCVLAEQVAQRNGLRPVTTEEDAYAAVGSWTAERAAAALVGDWEGAATHLGDLTQRVAVLALELVVPENLDATPVERILEVRGEHADLLTAFRTAVEDAVAALAQLPADIDDAVLRHYVEDEVQRAFETPKHELERALRSVRMPTVRALVGTKLELPAVLVSANSVASLDPWITSAIGAAVGIFNVRADRSAQREAAMAERPAAAYLLQVGHDLGRSGVLRRAWSAFRRLR